MQVTRPPHARPAEPALVGWWTAPGAIRHANSARAYGRLPARACGRLLLGIPVAAQLACDDPTSSIDASTGAVPGLRGERRTHGRRFLVPATFRSCDTTKYCSPAPPHSAPSCPDARPSAGTARGTARAFKRESTRAEAPRLGSRVDRHLLLVARRRGRSARGCSRPRLGAEERRHAPPPRPHSSPEHPMAVTNRRPSQSTNRTPAHARCRGASKRPRGFTRQERNEP